MVGEKDTPIRLEGVCFGNEVWGNPLLPPTRHHDERDFARVKEMRMNAIRFYLNYGLFEDDRRPYEYRETGWEWLDRNVEWAKKHGIYLIFNMHVPRAGSSPMAKGQPSGTTRDPRPADRLVAGDCRTYRDETIVAGYDLVNEPSPVPRGLGATGAPPGGGHPGGGPYHLSIVEHLNGLKGD